MNVLAALQGGMAILAQVYTPAAEGTNWLLIGGGIAGLLVVIVVIVLVMRGGDKDKKKVGKVIVTETQVDNYRLVNLMMTGQTSQVWEAAEIGSGRHFGLKMLLPEHVHSAQHRQFLFHEAEVGKQLVHPNIIKILNMVKDKDHPYLLMEFFPSTNLKLRLMHNDPFIKEHFKDIVEKTANGLLLMHAKGWIHRDVKPDNILVNASAEVRLIDFALAQRISKKKAGRRKASVKAQGTRSYMSPEQIRAEPLDPRADIYSFGVTLYELLTGRPPFRAASPADLLTKHIVETPATPQLYNPEVSKEMADLVLSMLSKEREGRPRDFHDFLMKFRGVRVFKAPSAPKKTQPS